MSVLLGNGNGTFQPAVNSATGGAAVSLAVGDFNGDGKLDLATANSAAAIVSVLLGNGDGTFQAPPPLRSHGRWTDVRRGGRLQRRRQARPGGRLKLLHTRRVGILRWLSPASTRQ